MCGLSGKFTLTPQKLDRILIYTLGISNDSRGGDSCGIAIDKDVDYGVGKHKLFGDYILNSKFLESHKNNLVRSTLVHCRKASVGNISRETAQPVVIKEGNEVKMILIHNGTIKNYQELAKEYIPNIDIKGMTDSQVMARIFYYNKDKNYTFLKKYIGGSVFIIMDYTKGEPRLLLFKGASKKWSSSTDIYEERPLYFILENNEFIFSSIFDYLPAVRPDSDFFDLRVNELVQVDLKNNNLKTIAKIDRSKSTQYTPTVSTYNYYDDYIYDSYYNLYPGLYGRGNNSTSTTTTTQTVSSKPGRSHRCSSQNTTTTAIIPSKKSESIQLGDKKNITIRFNDKSLSYTNYKNRLLNGKYIVNNFGVLFLDPNSNLLPFKEIYFFAGIPLRKPEYHAFLSKFCEKLKISPEEFINTHINRTLVRSMSTDPFILCKYGNEIKVCEVCSVSQIKPFTGSFQPLGSRYLFKYRDGIKVDTIYEGITFLDNYTKILNTSENTTNLITNLLAEYNEELINYR